MMPTEVGRDMGAIAVATIGRVWHDLIKVSWVIIIGSYF
jgi:hypothetical protein